MGGYNMNGGHNPFYWYCQKVLPLVFDESLSYYEVLLNLTAKINEVLDEIGSEHEEIYKYIDEKVNGIIDKANAYTDQKIAEEEKKVTELYNEILQMINVIYQYIDSVSARTKNYIDAQNVKIWDYVYQLGRQQSQIVINPITGAQDGLQHTLDQMASVLNINALTAREYDGLGLTAEEFDALGYTVTEWDFYARSLIGTQREKELHTMYHPVTGKRLFYQDIIYWCIDQHRENGLTAAQYDEKQITATGFEIVVDAYNYDFYGSGFFG